MLRECIYHRYEYPDIKSRLKTYLLKMVGRPSIIAKKFYFINLYGGEVWINDIDIIISEDEYWIYRLEIEHGEWCRQRQILIIREFNTLRDKCEEELQEHINDGKERYKRGLD